MKIHFSILSYKPSFITDEKINIGILFHNLSDGDIRFEITKNWARIKNFDDELDIDFFKLLLQGMNEHIYKHKDGFELKQYIKRYVNELSFSDVNIKNTDDFEEFILETKKIFLRYDFNKSERPNHSKQLSYMKSILKDNEIEFSTKVVKGNFDDNISYDYIIGNYGFKLFSFDGKKIKNLTSTAYKWAFIADEMKEKYKTVFIYDIKLDNDKNYNIIMRILSSKTNVDIISLNDILSYTKRIAPSQLEWKDIV